MGRTVPCESQHSETVCVCVFLIRKVSASITSVTPPSWVFHPLPQGHPELGPFSGNYPWKKEVASLMRKGERPGLGAEVWAKSIDLKGHLEVNPARSSCGSAETFLVKVSTVKPLLLPFPYCPAFLRPQCKL